MDQSGSSKLRALSSLVDKLKTCALGFDDYKQSIDEILDGVHYSDPLEFMDAILDRTVRIEISIY